MLKRVNDRKLQLTFCFKGNVIHGEKVGRTIGFPTANLDFLPTVKELKLGVYFGFVKIGEKSFHCLAYFGPRYIFGEEKNNFEVYIYDFDDDIYGQELVGELTAYIRPPKKLKGLKNLRAQLQHDMEIGYRLIAETKKKLT